MEKRKSFGASLVAQMVKRLPAVREAWVQSLSQEGSPREGNGNPLQYSCQENPMDRRAWWATIHGVAKSQMWLKGLSRGFLVLYLVLRWEFQALNSLFSFPKILSALTNSLYSLFLLNYSATAGEGNGNPLRYSCLENSWTEGAGRLQSMGSQRVGHDWTTSLSFFLSFLLFSGI